MSPNDLKSRVMLINIDLRWDGGRGVVVGAVGRFHLSPSQYPYAEVRGLRIPYGELDWNDLRNQLYEQLSRTWADASEGLLVSGHRLSLVGPSSAPAGRARREPYRDGRATVTGMHSDAPGFRLHP